MLTCGLCVVQLFRILKVVTEYFDEFHGWNACEHDAYDIPPNFGEPTILLALVLEVSISASHCYVCFYISTKQMWNSY